MSTGNTMGERGLTTLTSSQSAADVEDADKTVKNATVLGVKFFEVCKAYKELAKAKLDLETKDVKQLFCVLKDIL